MCRCVCVCIILHEGLTVPFSHMVPLKPGGQSHWKESTKGVVQVPPFMQGSDAHMVIAVKVSDVAYLFEVYCHALRS